MAEETEIAVATATDGGEEAAIAAAELAAPAGKVGDGKRAAMERLKTRLDGIHGAEPAAPAPDKPKEPAKEDEGKPGDLNDRQKQTAAHLRWDDERIKELGPVAQRVLDDFAKAHDTAMGKVGGKTAALLERCAKLEKENVELKAAKTAGGGKPSDDTDAEEITAEELELDPQKAATKLNALLRASREQLKAAINEFKSPRESGRSDAEPDEAAEKFFESLDEDGQAVFGRGPTAKLAADSPERAARERLTAIAVGHVQLMKNVLGEPMTLDESLRRMYATNDEVNALGQKRALDELRRKLRQRAGQTERRPDKARTGGVELTRKEQLLGALGEKLARIGE